MLKLEKHSGDNFQIEIRHVKKKQFKTKSRKYRNESTSVNLNKDKSGMRRRVRTLKTIENVRRF